MPGNTKIDKTQPTGQVSCLVHDKTPASYICASCNRMRNIPRILSSNGFHCIDCVVAELLPKTEALANA